MCDAVAEGKLNEPHETSGLLGFMVLLGSWVHGSVQLVKIHSALHL